MTLLTMSSIIWAGSLLAGFLGALTGLGGGVVIVPLLALAFGVDLRYAIASAGVYLSRGWLDPVLAAPVVLGVLPGALLGAKLLPKLRSRSLRLVFAGVIVLLAVEMLYRGATGKL
jgi:uncharacterized membrane protein YfcA